MTEEPTRKRTDDPIGRVIAGNLRRLRLHNGLTQEELAIRLTPYIGGKVSSAAISQWEDGRNPEKPVRSFSMTEVWAICKTFGVTLPRLLMPGLWEPSVDDTPTLFSQQYASIWSDLFADITKEDEASWYRLGMKIGMKETELQQDDFVRLATQPEIPEEWAAVSKDEFSAAFEIIRQQKQDKKEADRKFKEAVAQAIKDQRDGGS